MIDTLQYLFKRELNRLKDEIAAYNNESNIWKTEPNITNSAGNLCLHILGNLNHFIGATLGKTGYERDRPAEFNSKNIDRKILIDQIDETIEAIHQTLEKLRSENLQQDYPLIVMNDEKMSTSFFLVHLQGHLNYHLGQINYHRRLLDK